MTRLCPEWLAAFMITTDYMYYKLDMAFDGVTIEVYRGID